MSLGPPILVRRLIVTGLLAALSGTQAVLAGPAEASPPTARLSSGQAESQVRAGTFTWRQPDGSIRHGDGFGTVDPDAAVLAFASDEPLTLRFATASAPQSVTLHRRARGGQGGDQTTLQELPVPPGNPTSFPTNFPPGAWILTLVTRWTEGEALYSLPIRVTEATPADPTARPPHAVLASSAGTLRVPSSSYSWRQPSGSIVHADDFGRVDPEQRPLAVRQGETLTLRYGSAARPSSARLERFDIVRRQDGLWTGRQRQVLALPAANPMAFVADVPPGDWVLRISSTWPEGQVTHSFGIRLAAGAGPVQPRGAGPAVPVRARVSLTG